MLFQLTISLKHRFQSYVQTLQIIYFLNNLRFYKALYLPNIIILITIDVFSVKLVTIALYNTTQPFRKPTTITQYNKIHMLPFVPSADICFFTEGGLNTGA